MTNNGTPCISGGYTSMMTEEDSDLIRRSEAITAIQKAYADTEGGEDKCAVWKNVGLTNALHIMQDLPSAQPERTDCTECEEYDSETKSCPKYCETIRKTVEEAKQERTGRWIFKDDRRIVDGYDWQCDKCGSYQRYTSNYCPRCGARMEEENDETD